MNEHQHIALAAAALDQPRWLCLDCGQRLCKGPVKARANDTYATCDGCGQPEMCGAPSDFGGLAEGQ